MFFGRQEDEYSSKCVSHLRGLGFEVDTIWSNRRGERLPRDLDWTIYDYILCYRSYFILPKHVLTAVKKCCINFHPGSPMYPGSGGVNLALMNDNEEFGVTAHIMTEKLDDGDIIEFRSFKVHQDDDLSTLLDRTHNYLFCQFVELTTKLKDLGEEYIRDKIEANTAVWSEKKIKISELNKLQVIEPTITKSELQQRIRSLHHPDFPLEMQLHGHQFIFKPKI